MNQPAEKQVVVVESADLPAVTDQSNSVLAVITRAATDPNCDISKMERLLDMQERVMAQQAKMAFNADMSALQDEMPAIQKVGEIKVGQQVRSRYARFEDILSQTKPLLYKYGFSVTFKTSFVEGQLEVSGTLSHKLGHQESTAMRLPFDNSGAKNDVQQIGSSVSYGKRYVYCLLLNITITEEDDDGNAADASNNPVKLYERVLAHIDVVRDHLPSILAIKEGIALEDFSAAAEAWFELDDNIKQGLWHATTKGGIFTTKEREIMKTNAFKDSYYGGAQEA